MTAVSLPESIETGDMVSFSLAESHVVQIRYLKNIAQGEVSIFDVQGKVIAQRSLQNVTKDSYLSIPLYQQTGVFVVRVESGGIVLTRSFVFTDR